jgi:hypothetical protein
MKGSISIVKESAVSAIANLAQSAGEDIRPFYDTAVQFLHKMFETHSQLEYRELRGHIIECLSMMAVAAGPICF